ncbi:MAG: bifunctional nuclease family protein [Flavobacteriales bacterium]|nr:bifunctional nuclease family protein [Flavobacteriales bacterium]
MEKIKLEIVGLSYSQTQTGAYALVLGEETGKRRLPIIIGGFEAQAIAIELEKMQPSRPLTHDLFKTFAENFEIGVKEVIIYNLVEGIFYAKLVCNNGEKEVEIDTRTSDAIALAVRFECPIYTYEFILSSSGIVLEEDVIPEEFEEELEIDIADIAKSADPFNGKTVKELEKDLKEAIGMEDYEKASKIRDEIDGRKTS